MNTTVLVMIALPLIYFWLEVVVVRGGGDGGDGHLACRNNRLSSTSSRRLFLVLLMGMDGKIMIVRVVVLIRLLPLLLRYL